MNFFQTETLQYEHNRVAIVFLVPPLLSVFWMFDSPYPLQTLIFLVLAMYGMDLANARELLSVFLWVSAAILTMVTGWFMLLATPDDDDGVLTTLSVLLRTTGNCFLFLCLVRTLIYCIYSGCLSVRLVNCTFCFVLHLMRTCFWDEKWIDNDNRSFSRKYVYDLFLNQKGAWCTLQFEWVYADAPSWAKAVEKMLHSMLPPVAAAVTSFHLSGALEAELGIDFAATLLPLFFAVFLVAGMIFLGCCECSFVPSSNADGRNVKNNDKSDDKDYGKTGGPHTVTESFILPTRYARVHSTILLLVPALMHTMMFRRRIISSYVSMDDWLDLVLVWTIPSCKTRSSARCCTSLNIPI